MMNAPRFLAVMIASLIAGFAGLNLLSRAMLDGVRLDLTERGLYQLSRGGEDILARLDEPVSLTFYYSRGAAARYPAIRAYSARVRELLRTLSARAGGRIQLEEIDPSPFSAEEDAAIAAGLEAVAAEDGSQIFFGLTGRNAVDDSRTIAFFDPGDEARLEYEIMRVIAELERARTPSIAVISDLPFAPDRRGRSANRIIDELAGSYELEWLDAGFTAIPETADALFLLHPPPLDDAQAYLADQFALARGRVLVMVDPMAHIALKDGPDGLPPVNARRASSLERLFTAWGVVFDPETVAMDAEHGLPVQILEAGRARLRAYPLWFTIPPSGMDRSNPAVSALTRGINAGSPGVLEPAPGFEHRFTPLLMTSAGARRIDADMAAASPSPEDLMRGFEPDPDAPLTLAAQVSGLFETAFPGGPPASGGAFDPAAHLDASTGPGEIVIIADADMLDPAFFLRIDPVEGEQTAADNMAMILNLADRLAGDPALVSLRSRAVSARPMMRVEALRTRAEARYLALQDELRAELAEAEARLDALNRAGRASPMGGAGADQSQEAEDLRGRIVEARERLREIERGFRVEIDALENTLFFWTVWAPALMLGALAVLFAVLRRRRRT